MEILFIQQMLGQLVIIFEFSTYILSLGRNYFAYYLFTFTSKYST